MSETKSKRKYPLTLQMITDAVERSQTTLDSPGFCLACGLEHNEIEPDACNYVCEECGAAKVFGAEELLIRYA